MWKRREGREDPCVFVWCWTLTWSLLTLPSLTFHLLDYKTETQRDLAANRIANRKSIGYKNLIVSQGIQLCVLDLGGSGGSSPGLQLG